MKMKKRERRRRGGGVKKRELASAGALLLTLLSASPLTAAAIQIRSQEESNDSSSSSEHHHHAYVSSHHYPHRTSTQKAKQKSKGQVLSLRGGGGRFISPSLGSNKKSRTNVKKAVGPMSVQERASFLLDEEQSASSFLDHLKQQQEEAEYHEKASLKKSSKDLISKRMLGRTNSKNTEAASNGWMLAGTAAIVGSSLYFSGSEKLLLDMVQGSVAALTLAWLPHIVFSGTFGWVELASFASLLVQPSVRMYLTTNFLPHLKVTLQKIALSAAWKYIWDHIMPLPQSQWLVPRQVATGVPEWLQQPLESVNRMVDRFTRGLIRRTIQQSVHGTMGMVYDSMATSIADSMFSTYGRTEAAPVVDIFFDYATDRGEEAPDVVGGVDQVPSLVSETEGEDEITKD